MRLLTIFLSLTSYLPLAMADISWDVSADPTKAVTLTGSAKLLNASNQAAGGTYKLAVTQDSSGGYGLTYDTGYLFPVASYQVHPTPLPPVVSPGANAVSVLTFHSDGTSMHLVGTALDLETQIGLPTSVAATTNQVGNVHLSWTAGDGDHTLIQQQGMLGDWFDIATVTSATTTYDDAESAGSYVYRVLAKRGSNYSLPTGTVTGTAL